MLSIGLGSQPTTECGIFGSYQCLELDGNSDYVDLPHASLISSGVTLNAGTISCWVDIRDNDGASSQNIVRIANDSSNDNVTLQFHRANTEFRAVYKLDGTYKEATYNDGSLDLAGYMAQGWIHLAMTWASDGAGDGEVKIYFNGSLQDTVAQTSNWAPSIRPIDEAIIGAGDGGSSGFTDGFIDQIAIFTGTKSADEISGMYGNGKMVDLTTSQTNPSTGGIYNTRGLVGYYQFEGNALDSSGKGNHGTLAGTAGYNTSQP